MHTKSQKKPVIHFITNYVTANDMANVASGMNVSPIMADEPSEVADITSFADCLVINIGTINQMQFESIKIACKIANDRKIPIILDPVGVGCSVFRQTIIQYILNHFKIAIIKGNVSEINYLISKVPSNGGVDAIADIKDLNLVNLKKFCQQYDTVVVMTGPTDYIINKDSELRLCTKVSLAAKLVGTGCMLGAVIGTVAAKKQGADFHTATLAVLIFNYAKKTAYKKINSCSGISSFKTALLDCLGSIDEKTMKQFVNQ